MNKIKKIRTKDGREIIKEDSICWDCIHALPNKENCTGCEWTVRHEPVPGWDAELTIVCAGKGGHPYKSFLVKHCPKFEEGIRDTQMNDKADFEGLLENIIKRAMQDWDDDYKLMCREVENKNITKAVEISNSILKIERWFKSGCEELISAKTAKEILKHITGEHTDDLKLPEHTMDALVHDLKFFRNRFVTRRDMDIKVYATAANAEYDMQKWFSKDPKLCAICKDYHGSQCKECNFRWKGKPIQ